MKVSKLMQELDEEFLEEEEMEFMCVYFPDEVDESLE